MSVSTYDYKLSYRKGKVRKKEFFLKNYSEKRFLKERKKKKK